MPFSKEIQKLIDEQWQQLTKAQLRSTNIWQPTCQDAYDDLASAYESASERYTPECFNVVIDKAHQLRAALFQIDGGEECLMYIELINLNDMIYAGLKDLGHVGTNFVVPEQDDLIQRIIRLEKEAEEERRRTSQQDIEQRERLSEAIDNLQKSRQIIFNIINIDSSSIIAVIKDALEALKHGIDLLNDPRFTQPLRKIALATWLSGKRYCNAMKRRFAELKLPWTNESAIEEFDKQEPLFDFTLTKPKFLAVICHGGWDGLKQSEIDNLLNLKKYLCENNYISSSVMKLSTKNIINYVNKIDYCDTLIIYINGGISLEHNDYRHAMIDTDSIFPSPENIIYAHKDSIISNLSLKSKNIFLFGVADRIHRANKNFYNSINLPQDCNVTLSFLYNQETNEYPVILQNEIKPGVGVLDLISILKNKYNLKTYVVSNEINFKLIDD